MKKPVSRVLIINDEPLVLREFVKGLNAAARSLAVTAVPGPVRIVTCCR